MFCRKCGKEVNPNDKFCWNCGTPIAQPAARPAPEAPPVKEAAPQPEPEITAQQAAPHPQPEEAAPAFTPKPQMAAPVQSPQSAAAGMVSAAYSDKVVDVSKETEEYDYRKLPTERPTGIRSIYFVDFLLRLTGKSNIPLCIYLVLNVFLIGLFVTAFFQLPIGWGIVGGLLLYIASISIAISPIGEWILRQQNGCRKITDTAVLNRLEPLFREVYYKAKKGNPMISSDVRLFINDDECPNAFATGRKTICVTKGLLDWSDDEIKAALGHEFGHLAHKDTDRILVVAIGNTVIAVICYLFQLAAIVLEVLMTIFAAFLRDDGAVIVHLLGALARFLTLVVVRAFNWIWTQIGVMLCMKTSRDNEYLADEFSFNLGYGNALCQLLSTLPEEKPKGLFANLASSHPDSAKRVAHLQGLGATYGKAA